MDPPRRGSSFREGIEMLPRWSRGQRAARRWLAAGRFGARRMTCRLRRLPDFVIIGAQKAGTTTLYARVVAHPLVMPALRKEVHYFDFRAGTGLGWYRAHLPTRMASRITERRHGGRCVTGEASPFYLFHPEVPERMHAAVPDVKLVAILRDPVERAVSEYHGAVRRGVERRPIEVALDPSVTDVDRPAVPERTAEFDEPVGSIRRHSYLARGRYAEQLHRWFDVFPREQLLVLETEELREGSAVDRVLGFLELRPMAIPPVRDQNVQSYEAPAVEVQRRLAAYYAPHNEALWDLLGVRWGWTGVDAPLRPASRPSATGTNL